MSGGFNAQQFFFGDTTEEDAELSTAMLGDGTCVCEELVSILKGQGLTMEQFLQAAEQAPDEFTDFVHMNSELRH